MVDQETEKSIPVPGTTPEYDAGEKVARSLFDDALAAAEAALIKAAPWLAFPVLKQLFKFILGKIAHVLYRSIETNIALIVIQARVSGERAAYERALAELKPILENPNGVPDAEKQKALEEYRRRLRDLIRIGR